MCSVPSSLILLKRYWPIGTVEPDMLANGDLERNMAIKRQGQYTLVEIVTLNEKETGKEHWNVVMTEARSWLRLFADLTMRGCGG